MTEHLDDSTQQFAPLFGANNAVSGTVADSVDAAASDSIQGDEMRRRRIWPWVVIACLLVALGAACGGGVWFFQDHVLPGTTLWGNSVTGKTEQELFEDLKGVIFLNPMHISEEDGKPKYLPADEYLSGNVREKLALARKSAELYPEDYTVNVEALERVQPKDLTASEIAAREEEKLILVGPVLERLHDELFIPLMDRTFECMRDLDMLPPCPPELAGERDRRTWTQHLHEIVDTLRRS